jgi:hypothetical protein
MNLVFHIADEVIELLVVKLLLLYELEKLLFTQ